jgi:methylmalonyl-CoA mutase N-terminal domain/subunit
MLPSDFLKDNPSQDWVRTAIHTMHILKQEAHLDLVRDPLEGSYYVEDLSSKILDHLIISFKP